VWRIAGRAAVLTIEEGKSGHLQANWRDHVSAAVDGGTSVRNSSEEILTSLGVRRI